MEPLRLVWPALEYVPGYADALLPYAEITTDPGNVASQHVIEKNGGVLFERFTKPAQFGSMPGLRYRIAIG